MYIAVNNLGNPRGQGRNPEAVIAGFQRAMAGMKKFPGFLGLEIWTAEDGTMQGVSRWTSKEAIDGYLNSSLFQQHHGHAGSSQHAQHHHGGAEGSQPADHTQYYCAQVVE